MTTHPQPSLPKAALMAGYAGVLPQLIAAALVLSGSEYRWTGLAAAYGYAAFIFSFLGGVWWGFAAGSRREGIAAGPVFVLAVLPSLLAFATYLPWIWGYSWPGPSLMWLGILLMLSPLADRWLSKRCVLPEGWMRLRWHLSLTLGGLTSLLAAVA